MDGLGILGAGVGVIMWLCARARWLVITLCLLAPRFRYRFSTRLQQLEASATIGSLEILCIQAPVVFPECQDCLRMAGLIGPRPVGSFQYATVEAERG